MASGFKIGLYCKDYLNRSLFGYVWVYNILPASIVNCKTTKDFQKKKLQITLKTYVSSSDVQLMPAQ